MKDVYLGSHLSLKSPDYFLGAAKEAIAWGENAFMIYTGAPANSLRLPLERLKIAEGQAYLRDAGFSLDNLVIHAPYIINLGQRQNEEKSEFARTFLKQELRRVAGFGGHLLVLHPGSSLGLGEEEGLCALVENLDRVLDEDETDVTVCLETMAGKKNELGGDFSFYAKVLTSSHHADRLGITLDTCHINDAGYDVNDAEAVLEEFDRVIGLSRLKVVHLNDSLNPRFSHKDRHANIGRGTIGFSALRAFAFHPKIAGIPTILETPYIHENPPYAKEILALRENDSEALPSLDD